MIHDAAVVKAREIASQVLAPSAGENDKAVRFSTEAVASLGESGLLGLMLPAEVGGSGLGPRTLAVVTATLAEADASVAMVYLMHILGAATISAARPSAAQALTPILKEICGGRHLSTLAFSMTSATGTLRPALLIVSTAVGRSMLQAHIRMRMPRSTSLEFCMCTLTMRFSYT